MSTVTLSDIGREQRRRTLRSAQALLDTASIDAELARRKFKYFVPMAWDVIEPARPFIPNWHIDGIVDHLQAVADGEIQNLLITVPPGHAKSILVAVLWHPWMWLRKPEWRVLCTTYSNDLTLRDAGRARMILRSDWYLQTFKPEWSMQVDQDTKGFFQNTKLGFRYSTSVGGQSTGHRGDCIIADDVLSASDGESEAMREEMLFWWDYAFANRLNDMKRGARVVIGQRLRDNDLPGHLMKSMEQGGDKWEHLKLPSIFDKHKRCVTSIGWSDPRKEDGELLFPKLFSPRIIASEKHRLGAYGFSAQHQQEPTPAGGGKFKRIWFRYFETEINYYVLHQPDGAPPKRILKSDCWTFQTADLAPTDKESSSYTAIGTWVVTQTNDLMLIDVHRFKEEGPEVKKALEGARARWKPMFQGIERAHFGIEVCQEWVRRGYPLKELPVDKDKLVRSMPASLLMENGKVYHLQGAHWLADYEDELLHFNKGEYDDQVDMFSHAAWVIGNEAPMSVDCKPVNLGSGNARGQLAYASASR